MEKTVYLGCSRYEKEGKVSFYVRFITISPNGFCPKEIKSMRMDKEPVGLEIGNLIRLHVEYQGGFVQLTKIEKVA